MTDLLTAIFEIGFQAGTSGDFKDAQEAIEDKDVTEAIAAQHEEFGNDVLDYVEAKLDIERDEEPEGAEEKVS